MKKRNLLCILLAAMMLTALPGCGGDSTADKGTDDSSRVSRRDRDDEDDSKDDPADSEDSADEKEDSGSSKDDADDDSGSSDRDDTSSDSSKAPENSTSDTGGNDTGSRADYEAAQAALEAFLDAVMNGDREDVLEYSDLGTYYEMCKLLYAYDEDDGSLDTDFEEFIDELFADADLESYTIGEGEQRNDIAEEYEAFIADAKAELEEEYQTADDWDEDDEEEYELMKQILDLYPTIGKIYAFPVTEITGGETVTEHLLVAFENGSWKMDLLMISQTIGYPSEYDD